MDNDLTILYCTCNKVSEEILERFRQNLLIVTKGQYPIISVSQKPIDFGTNICVGELGQSKYNEYLQILTGLREIKTKYVAIVDDDTLYSAEHFLQRPSDDTFLFESNYWFAQIGQEHYWRIADENKKGGMWGCISNTQNILNNLETRYKLYPTPDNLPPYFGEPGWHDEQFGMTSKRVIISSSKPCVIFVHSTSMGGIQLVRFRRRYGDPLPENRCEVLEGFGSAKELIIKYWS